MAAITAAMVKDLREKTGAGMMDCKKALVENDGDMNKATDWLREKGISKAAKKAGRIAAEGAVYAYISDDHKVGVLLEVNCETDFAARNENFVKVEEEIAKHIAKVNPKDLDELNDSVLNGKKVSDIITEATATIGEKISLRRFTRYESSDMVAAYIHMGGKIGVLVEMQGGSPELGKDVAMQVAATSPMAVDRNGVDASALEHEKEVLRKQALEEGKPEKIVDKMVIGRINKFYEEVCLIEQKFVKDLKGEKTVKDILGGATVKQFTRYQLGEGIEKKQEDFAAEVAAQMK